MRPTRPADAHHAADAITAAEYRAQSREFFGFAECSVADQAVAVSTELERTSSRATELDADRDRTRARVLVEDLRGGLERAAQEITGTTPDHSRS